WAGAKVLSRADFCPFQQRRRTPTTPCHDSRCLSHRTSPRPPGLPGSRGLHPLPAAPGAPPARLPGQPAHRDRPADRGPARRTPRSGVPVLGAVAPPRVLPVGHRGRARPPGPDRRAAPPAGRPSAPPPDPRGGPDARTETLVGAGAAVAPARRVGGAAGVR